MKKLLLVLILLVCVLMGCGSETNSQLSEEDTQNEGIVIYEDNFLKATYVGVAETSGVAVMTVSLENKTESEITVLPMDSSVDGTTVQFTSGTIATIQGGKTFNQGWIIGSMPTEVIEFSMSICDKDMSELVKTDILTVEVK